MIALLILLLLRLCGHLTLFQPQTTSALRCAGCDVVIVACRSRTGTASVDALERQAISRGLIVDYTTLMWNASLPRLIVVEQDIARRIASRI